ncbi:MAG: hypothetical protein JXR37_24295 [Kiritimatiellae bacterium]|nr:hypothetical protein [Kiritimatiellia bacterium]
MANSVPQPRLTGSQWVLPVAIALLTLLAWRNRFIQDDAFISFRYAANLAAGQGLTWNPGDRIEGYTNFLWTLIMTVPELLGIGPVAFSYTVGLALFAGTLWLTWKLACLVLGSRRAGMVSAVLLGTNYTFSAYATGGMETQLQACLFTASIYQLLRVVRTDSAGRRPWMLLGVLCAAAMLTRLDSGLCVGVVSLVLLVHLLRGRMPGREGIVRAAAFGLPLALIVGAWLVWKITYYGDILPNTYYNKGPSPAALPRGLFYCFTFLRCYWLLPLVLIVPLASGRILKSAAPGIRIVCLLLLIWWTYVASVGGDFMEFRFLVPSLPFLVLLVTWLLYGFVDRLVRVAGIRVALVLAIISGSVHHAVTFKGAPGIESVARLQGHITNRNENWAGVGKALGKLFPAESDVLVAVSPAGAIPYYSRLPTVDMLGQNDRWVARHGHRMPRMPPGHQRRATFDYLLGRRAHLVIGPPQVTARRPAAEKDLSLVEFECFGIPQLWLGALPRSAKIIEVPLDAEFCVYVLYLTSNPCVESAIRTHGLRTYGIREALHSQRGPLG